MLTTYNCWDANTNVLERLHMSKKICDARNGLGVLNKPLKLNVVEIRQTWFLAANFFNIGHLKDLKIKWKEILMLQINCVPSIDNKTQWRRYFNSLKYFSIWRPFWKWWLNSFYAKMDSGWWNYPKDKSRIKFDNLDFCMWSNL